MFCLHSTGISRDETKLGKHAESTLTMDGLSKLSSRKVNQSMVLLFPAEVLCADLTASKLTDALHLIWGGIRTESVFLWSANRIALNFNWAMNGTPSSAKLDEWSSEAPWFVRSAQLEWVLYNLTRGPLKAKSLFCSKVGNIIITWSSRNLVAPPKNITRWRETY